MGGAAEHRSERIRGCVKRGAQKATMQMGCLDAKDLVSISGLSSKFARRSKPPYKLLPCD
jgi:hypothetical protein